MKHDEPGAHLVPAMVWIVLAAQIIVLLVLLFLPGCVVPGDLVQQYCREDRPACASLKYRWKF